MHDRRPTTRPTCWLFTACVLLAAAWPSHAQPVDPNDIQNAIDILRSNLYRMQDERTGAWFGKTDETPEFEDPRHDAGLTVLASYALLASGESPEVDERLAKAIEYVERSQRQWTKQIDGTYVIALRNHIWPLLPREQYAAALDRDTKRLIAGANPNRSTFSYLLSKPPPDDFYDHSTTQYGVLGLWEAAKHDARVPERFWENAAAHFIDTQFANGGWAYRSDKEPSKSMTCAGLTVLTIAQQQLGRTNKTVNPKLEQAIQRGLDALDAMFDEGKTVYSGSGYYLYSVERVALATGRSRFGKGNGGKGTEWFENFARYIIDRVQKPSDTIHTSAVNSSFFLLFLSRGDTPVFFNKLDLTSAGQIWNNRPNDIYFLAKQLSETFQSELNFRNVPIDWEIERWLGSPMSYVSIDQPLELNDDQTETIKQYLDLGGLLIVNPESNTRKIAASIDTLLNKMYPGAKLQDAPADHPALSLWRPVPKPPKLKAYHNGVRDLVLMPMDDIGFDWQKGGRDGDNAYVFGANLYLHTTGYQRMRGRVATAFPPDPRSAARGDKKSIAVVTPTPGLEPGLWEYQRRELGRPPQPASRRKANPRPAESKPTANLDIVRQLWENAGQPIDAHDQTAPPDLLHLVGIDATALPDDAIQRIVEYAQAGGTVLIETLGGQGEFAPALEDQFAAALGQPPETLSRYETVYAADPNKNTYDLGRVTYRAYSVRNFSTDNKPRLAAFRVKAPGDSGDRPAIFISGEDLSLAAMGVRHWNIHGYTDESARQLLTNLLLNQ